MKKLDTRLILPLIAVAAALALAASYPASAAVAPGSLVKGSLPGVYYVGSDGKRYVFPNEKTYGTWYADFNSVITVSNQELAAIQIGGNVTYRPGVRMIKIVSDPRVYAVAKGGVLRWVASEAAASALYGADWNRKIDDVSDAFFTNYRIGTDIAAATDYNPSSETSFAPNISDDKSLAATPTISSPAPAPASSGPTYYVSPTGSDTNSGTKTQPWATPGYASRQLKPGDTLIIMGGRYQASRYDNDIVTPPSGTSGAWITIKGEDGHRPVLAGTDNLLTVVNLSNASYVKLENLEITHDGTGEARDGIEATDGPANHVILKNLYVHHLDEFCVNIGDTDDLQIIDSVLSYCGFGAVGGPAGLHGGWRNVVISGSELSYSGHYYQGGAGPSPYDRPDGFGIEASQGPIDIFDTLVQHNRGDGIDSKAANTSIHESTVANNACDGVKLWGPGSKVVNALIYGRGDGSLSGTPWAAIVIDSETAGRFELTNVTVDDVVGQNYLMYVQYDHPSVPITLAVRNTIFSGRGENSPIYLADGVTPAFDHDLFYFPNSDTVFNDNIRQYTGSEIGQLGSTNHYGDPLFTATGFGSNGDYRLRTGSPGIDAGSSTSAPSADIDGLARPRGANFDLGAYER